MRNRNCSSEIQNLDNMAGADAEQKNDLVDLREELTDLAGRLCMPVISQVRGGGKVNDIDLNLHGKA